LTTAEWVFQGCLFAAGMQEGESKNISLAITSVQIELLEEGFGVFLF
jgi:hypothetical protein